MTSRGNGRADIFYCDEDRRRFLALLAHDLQQCSVVLYAYALMDNHLHVLVRTPRANLSRFMQRLLFSYALYSGYRHRRPGLEAMTGSRYAIGPAEFIKRTKERNEELRSGRIQDRDLDLPRWSVSLKEIDSAVAGHYRVEPSLLSAHGSRAGPANLAAVDLAARLADKLDVLQVAKCRSDPGWLSRPTGSSLHALVIWAASLARWCI